jgi:cytochrome c-type biogenesis protein CcmH/NrfF
MTRAGWCVVALTLLGLPGARQAAAQPPGRADADTVARAAALEHEARQIETMLIAPCCWREQVSVHQSEAAEQVKQEIRAMLAAGLTRQQVLDRFVSAYGVRILAEPPDEGFGRVLHHAPWVVGLGSLVALAFFMKHVTRRKVGDEQVGDGGSAGHGQPVAPTAETPSGDDDQRRLDDELRDLD